MPPPSATRLARSHIRCGEDMIAPRDRSLMQQRRGHVTALPKKESAAPNWQAAIEALMLVVELGGPTMFARIGVMRALNR
jgi:hypothetical protein